MFQRGGGALTESVHVDDGDQIVELVVAREVESLPVRALRCLSIAENTVCAIAAIARLV